MNKKIISFLLLISIIFSYNTSFAVEKTDLYKEYKTNVEKNCLEAPFYTEADSGNKYIYIYEKYQKHYPSVEELKNDSKVKYLLNWSKETFWLSAIKEVYRETQNEIYKCWIISAQFRWYKIVEQNLKLDKTWMVKNLVESIIEPKIERLKSANKKCKFDDNELIVSKKQILDQSTFELCKYSYYLDYLKDYYSDVEKILGIDKTQNNKEVANQMTYDPKIIEAMINNTNAAIDNEKQHSFKIYPIVFTAYSEYQSNFPIHIALELLKDNLIIFREKLYKTLSPISEVVYKYINAMNE